MELIKITPDKEKARSIVKMVSLIKERIKKQERDKMAALIIADYYEIIKELITAILLIDGYKTLSHKDLIDYIKEKYKEFSIHEISVLDDLRVLRNRIAYEGFFIEPSYLERNEPLFKEIIRKLENLIERKLR
jgi:hypothetical protein